jgi:nitrate reductase NapAB chaperone NapD
MTDPTPARGTQYSGILVVALPQAFAATLARLATLPGLEIFQTDPATGRAIVVQEAGERADPQALHRRILATDGVLSADLVVHVVDPETPDPMEPAEAGEPGGLT